MLVIIGRNKNAISNHFDSVPEHERTEPGKGGEIQLTDALQELAADPNGPGVYGVVFRGRRYDTGDRVDYIKAIVQLAADREDLGPELRPWFKDFAATL